MQRDEVLRILREHRDELDEYHVRSLALFGTAARDEAGPASDVDVLVEFSIVPSLLTLIHIENQLSDLLGIKVDLVMKSALKPRIRDRVLAEAVPV
jgi:predicted nucleotidyltransferase